MHNCLKTSVVQSLVSSDSAAIPMLLLTALSQGSSLADLQPLWALYCLQSHGLGPKSDDQWQQYSWRPVISGECQGSLLGPILFNTFSNGLDDGAECTLSKAADYTKLGVADVPESGAAIQRDYSWLEKWADRNLMKYNKEKCLVQHCLEKRLQASLCASWEAAWQKRVWAPSWTPRWT